MGVGNEAGRADASLRSEQPKPDARWATSRSAPARPPTAYELAWLAAIPTAALGVVAILVLGPPLGDALLPTRQARFWSSFLPQVRPEPAEQGRYLVALTVPLLLTALMSLGLRAGWRWRAATVGLLVAAVQIATVLFLLVCLLQQNELFGRLYPHEVPEPLPIEYFTRPTLLIAAAGTITVILALRRPRLRTALARWGAETRGRSLAAGGAAVVAILVWLLCSFYTEATVGYAQGEALYHLFFTIDETYAVLDGRSPLVDFAAQYGSLWPYPFAAAMSLLGDSVGVWVGLALCATGAGMLAIFAVLRRAARSSIGGLLLFLPVLATSFFMIEGPRQSRYSFENYFGTFPMRYAGPSILAWAVARHLGGVAPRRAWLLFLLAGIVVLNNVDAGVPALGATVAALLWCGPSGRGPTRASTRRLAVDAALGLACAFALVSLLTLLRAGTLPDLGLLLRFSRLFASSGFAMQPLPLIGPYLVVYLTLVAAVVTASVRALRGDPDRVLTGMLAWSGVFGLGAAAYYVGRSTPDDLIAIFFPWSFATALLIIPALGALSARSWRSPPFAAAACVFGFLVMGCSLAQTPTPWEQLDRLQQTGRPGLAVPTGQRFVAERTRHGERVAILLPLGHRIGVNLGVVNVSPYSNSLSMPTAEQLDETIAMLRAAGGRKFFVDPRLAGEDFQRALEAAGFAFAGAEPHTGLWLAGESG